MQQQQQQQKNAIIKVLLAHESRSECIEHFSHGAGCHISFLCCCKLQHKTSCSCETLLIAGRFDQRQDKLLSSPPLGYQAWSCQSLLPWTCFPCKCLQWDGGSGLNSRQHSQVAGIGRTPMTSRGISEHLSSWPRLRKQLQCRLKAFQTRWDTFCGFSWKKRVWKPGGGTSSNWGVTQGWQEWGQHWCFPSDLSLRSFLNQDQYHLYQEAIHGFPPIHPHFLTTSLL